MVKISVKDEDSCTRYSSVTPLVKHLIITGVKFTGRELGRGSFARVFAVEYNGITCTAKEIQEEIRQTELFSAQFKQDYLLQCLQHSRLHHPNIVKMLGVYYPNDQAVLPILVMELMECNLEELPEYSHVCKVVNITRCQ